MSNASAITDAIINNLSSASVIGACQVGTHWATLETTTACCALVSLAGLESNRWTLGNAHERFYNHKVTVFVKDRSGNSERMETDTQKLVDISVCSLEADPTLQSAENIAELGKITGTHDPTTVVQAGGATWYTADLVLTTKVWPDN